MCTREKKKKGRATAKDGRATIPLCSRENQVMVKRKKRKREGPFQHVWDPNEKISTVSPHLNSRNIASGPRDPSHSSLSIYSPSFYEFPSPPIDSNAIPLRLFDVGLFVFCWLLFPINCVAIPLRTSQLKCIKTTDYFFFAFLLVLRISVFACK